METEPIKVIRNSYIYTFHYIKPKESIIWQFEWTGTHLLIF